MSYVLSISSIDALPNFGSYVSVAASYAASSKMQMVLGERARASGERSEKYSGIAPVAVVFVQRAHSRGFDREFDAINRWCFQSVLMRIKYKCPEGRLFRMSRTEVEAEGEKAEARRRVEEGLLNETLSFDREIDRLKAIGEETRFIILYLMAAEGEIHSGELADLLDRQQNDLYHHLDALEDAGLVGKYRADDGGRVYELSPLAERMVTPIFDAIRERADAV